MKLFFYAFILFLWAPINPMHKKVQIKSRNPLTISGDGFTTQVKEDIVYIKIKNLSKLSGKVCAPECRITTPEGSEEMVKQKLAITAERVLINTKVIKEQAKDQPYIDAEFSSEIGAITSDESMEKFEFYPELLQHPHLLFKEEKSIRWKRKVRSMSDPH